MKYFKSGQYLFQKWWILISKVVSTACKASTLTITFIFNWSMQMFLTSPMCSYNREHETDCDRKTWIINNNVIYISMHRKIKTTVLNRKICWFRYFFKSTIISGASLVQCHNFLNGDLQPQITTIATNNISLLANFSLENCFRKLWVIGIWNYS